MNTIAKTEFFPGEYILTSGGEYSDYYVSNIFVCINAFNLAEYCDGDRRMEFNEWLPESGNARLLDHTEINVNYDLPKTVR